MYLKKLLNDDDEPTARYAFILLTRLIKIDAQNDPGTKIHTQRNWEELNEVI